MRALPYLFHIPLSSHFRPKGGSSIGEKQEKKFSLSSNLLCYNYKRALLPFLFFTSLSFARENPFVPIVSPEGGFSAKEATNIESTFSKEIIQLPSSARKLVKVTVEFQNIDGSIDKMEKTIDREIDWHYPVLITQTTNKNIKITPKTTKQSKKIKALNFISFEIENNILKIYTKDRVLRDFAITAPSKIVIDFNSNRSFNTKIVPTNMAIFKDIAIGNHKGFYRVAIELDGVYRYALTLKDYGVEVRVE